MIKTSRIKKIIFLSTFLFSVSVHALPDCPSDTSVRWNNCFGTYTYAGGNIYVGEYKDGKRHGQGTYTYASGNIYVGEWKEDGRHGQGTYTFTNGDIYVGEYKDGKRHGQGTFTFVDGTKYVGFFMNNDYVPNICEGMGLVKGTESFGNCVNNLIDDL